MGKGCLSALTPPHTLASPEVWRDGAVVYPWPMVGRSWWVHSSLFLPKEDSSETGFVRLLRESHQTEPLASSVTHPWIGFSPFYVFFSDPSFCFLGLHSQVNISPALLLREPRWRIIWVCIKKNPPHLIITTDILISYPQKLNFTVHYSVIN